MERTKHRVGVAYALTGHCTDCPPGVQTAVVAAETTVLAVPLFGAFGSGGAKATTGITPGPNSVQGITYGCVVSV